MLEQLGQGSSVLTSQNPGGHLSERTPSARTLHHQWLSISLCCKSLPVKQSRGRCWVVYCNGLKVGLADQKRSLNI